MQALRILPLLISVLAAANSLFMPHFAGPSIMPVIPMLVFIMLSPEQAIIFAEAGVKAKAENMAVIVKIFFIGSSLNQTNMSLALKIRSSHAVVADNSRKIFLCSATQKTD